MNISEALEILNWTSPRSPAELRVMAENFLDCCTAKCPLRYKVAATTILRNV